MEWTEAHDCLERIMKRELETLRQLLENLNLEEQFILRKDKQYWNNMMEERAQLLKQLTTIQHDRAAATEKLESINHLLNAPLEALLPPQHMNSWEILLLKDQMATLVDRMNLQSSRNKMLQQVIQAAAAEPKRKNSIITLTEDA